MKNWQLSRREIALIREAKKKAIRDYKNNTLVSVYWDKPAIRIHTINELENINRLAGKPDSKHIEIFFSGNWRDAG